MKLLFVADGRSPIALNWIRHFVESGHEVHLASTVPCSPDLPLASVSVIPLNPGGMGRRGSAPGKGIGGARGIGLRNVLRHWLGPLMVLGARDRLRQLVSRLGPDLVHGMRIPLEGMLTAEAAVGRPVVLSVWGNDFTLHAPASPLMSGMTRRAVRRAWAIHVDCHRDLRLARVWGFPQAKPYLVAPGNGGVRREVFFPDGEGAGSPESARRGLLDSIPGDAPVVVNPRGFRAYVRNDVFFQAARRLRVKRPNVVFLCPAMQGEAEADAWIRRLHLEDSVFPLPPLSADEMATVFRRATISVSPSEHDGIPNTLLEAMACGCFPVAGDLDSLREWIEPGMNGLLVDPSDPSQLASVMDQALEDQGLRERAREHNLRLISERAEYTHVMRSAEAFYEAVLGEGVT
jgi:glycosyltransferase involved in cell wall biosynthesis